MIMGEESIHTSLTNIQRCTNTDIYVNGTATISLSNATQLVKEGDVAFEKWDVRSVSSDFVVIDRNFDRFGLVSYLSLSSSWSERKAIGKLTTIEQPYFNLSSRYIDRVNMDPTDYPWTLASSETSNNNVTFSDIARTLTPQRDLVAISNKNTVVKFVVSHVGRIKCGARKNTIVMTEGGIAELRNASSPLPNNQTVIFDPANVLSEWPDRFENTKTGLLGGYFNIANVGSYSNSTGHGFELIAFVAASPLANEIDFAPSVLVSIREDHFQKDSIRRYYRVSNFTNKTIDSVEFYREMNLARARILDEFQGSMDISLPLPDGARQRDMAKFGIFSSLSNFVYNQSNYGFGGTYWSVAREDNGSLPLNVLTVDEALMNWGLCDVAIDHLDYYVRNYIEIEEESASFLNYTWGSAGDSLSDFGRLITILIRAVTLCRPDLSTKQRFVNVSIALSHNLLSRIATVERTKHSNACSCDGLLTGAPEHDWSNVRDRCFFNNNVWTFRGLESLDTYLDHQDTNLANMTLVFRHKLESALGRCTTQSTGFLPPYANLTYKPFHNMTESREASYSNFRFYPETLLAGFLSTNTLNALLDLHNVKGGRVGGASRWQDHLDDMPVAGWGFGALLANRTADFHALLYGHSATYQSRGSFHTTEQLSFLGTGLYRDFLHFTDPPVIPPTFGSNDRVVTSKNLGAGYYSAEQDISFCIVTQILTARLTRWQLVFEDIFDSKSIWLARAAPDRWFEHGFNVSRAPTFCGNISFTYDTSRMYNFRIERVSSRCLQGDVWFNFRWYHDLTSVHVVVSSDVDVRLVQVDRENRFASVVLLGDDNDDDTGAVEFSLVAS